MLLTGGHAPGIQGLPRLRRSAIGCCGFLRTEKPVGAICHGVLLAARSSLHPGKSVLYGKKTTALTKQMELIAWRLTRSYLGDYYRTYQTTVKNDVADVSRSLKTSSKGRCRYAVIPRRSRFDITVRDGHYLSARWPGDASLASEFAAMIG